MARKNISISPNTFSHIIQTINRYLDNNNYSINQYKDYNDNDVVCITIPMVKSKPWWQRIIEGSPIRKNTDYIKVIVKLEEYHNPEDLIKIVIINCKLAGYEETSHYLSIATVGIPNPERIKLMDNIKAIVIDQYPQCQSSYKTEDELFLEQFNATFADLAVDSN